MMLQKWLKKVEWFTVSCQIGNFISSLRKNTVISSEFEEKKKKPTQQCNTFYIAKTKYHKSGRVHSDL